MLIILDVLQASKPYKNQQVTTFQFQFMVHLVVDVLVKLKKIQQNDMFDISAIGRTLDASISILRTHFLCGLSSNFGQLTKHLRPFLSKGWVDGVLKWGATNGLKNTYHPMVHSRLGYTKGMSHPEIIPKILL
jgi:hypothetical protein